MLEIIKSRHSVRKFKPDPIPENVVLELLEAARWAPSAGNLQPWFYYVITSPKDKEALSALALNQRFIARAPLCIVVCAEPEKSAGVYGGRGRNLYCYQDTAAAVQNILLAAAGHGLGSCWVGAFREEGVQQYLNMPDGRVPIAIIPVGHPDEKEVKRPGRRDLKEICRFY